MFHESTRLRVVVAYFKASSFAAVLAIVLAACATNVARAPEAALQQPQFDEPGEKAGSLSIGLSDAAKKDVADNLKFDQGRLRYTINRALEVKNLIAATPDSSLPAVEVTVTSVRVRSNFSAVMFGFFAGNDHIDGEIVVRASDGNELQRFSVSASYALGGLAGGQDSVRMDWLYESFATLVADELTGKSKTQ